jgi:putative spermidine/putrescine transport system permease protein
MDGVGLIGPATLFIALCLLAPLAILLRYSLNEFEPTRKMMVEAADHRELRQVLHRSLLHDDPRHDRAHRGDGDRGLPDHRLPAGLRRGAQPEPLQAPADHRHRAAAVRRQRGARAGWMVVFGSKGFFNSTLMDFGLIAQPFEIMFTEKAVIIGIIAVNLPFMVLSLQSVIEGIDRAVEEAAYSLGAPPATMFRRVLWPLALPGILAGTILTFILAMNAYATPFLLGGPLFKMMAPVIYNEFTQKTNWPFGGAIAFILMAVTLSLTIAANLILQRRAAR